jgi:transposase InsO family protein
VVETLERVTAIYGVPKSIRFDNGPEFISRDDDLWAWSNGVTLDFSRPGKSTDNAFVEVFNGKIQAECSDQNWFLSLNDGPLSAIGNKAPSAPSSVALSSNAFAWRRATSSGLDAVGAIIVPLPTFAGLPPAGSATPKKGVTPASKPISRS